MEGKDALETQSNSSEEAYYSRHFGPDDDVRPSNSAIESLVGPLSHLRLDTGTESSSATRDPTTPRWVPEVSGAPAFAHSGEHRSYDTDGGRAPNYILVNDTQSRHTTTANARPRSHSAVRTASQVADATGLRGHDGSITGTDGRHLNGDDFQVTRRAASLPSYRIATNGPNESNILRGSLRSIAGQPAQRRGAERSANTCSIEDSEDFQNRVTTFTVTRDVADELFACYWCKYDAEAYQSCWQRDGWKHEQQVRLEHAREHLARVPGGQDLLSILRCLRECMREELSCLDDRAKEVALWRAAFVRIFRDYADVEHELNPFTGCRVLSRRAAISNRQGQSHEDGVRNHNQDCPLTSRTSTEIRPSGNTRQREAETVNYVVSAASVQACSPSRSRMRRATSPAQPSLYADAGLRTQLLRNTLPRSRNTNRIPVSVQDFGIPHGFALASVPDAAASVLASKMSYRPVTTAGSLAPTHDELGLGHKPSEWQPKHTLELVPPQISPHTTSSDQKLPSDPIPGLDSPQLLLFRDVRPHLMGSMSIQIKLGEVKGAHSPGTFNCGIPAAIEATGETDLGFASHPSNTSSQQNNSSPSTSDDLGAGSGWSLPDLPAHNSSDPMDWDVEYLDADNISIPCPLSDEMMEMLKSDNVPLMYPTSPTLKPKQPNEHTEVEGFAARSRDNVDEADFGEFFIPEMEADVDFNDRSR